MEERVMLPGGRDGLTWEEEKAIHTELVARRDALAEQERQAAYAAVTAALAAYRWWHLGNILNTIRMWRARRRFVRNLKRLSEQ